MGVRSRATLTVQAGRAVWFGDVPVGVPTDGDVLDVLARTLEVLRTPRAAGLPPLTGGLVGARVATSCGTGSRPCPLPRPTSWACPS